MMDNKTKELNSNTEVGGLVEPVVRQTIYEHGGSRIWTETDKGRRNLLADTYEDEELALRVKACIDQYLKDRSA